ncbi:MAG: hypothetical protein AABX23_03400 [Nanoarchaeota archaeon]
MVADVSSFVYFAPVLVFLAVFGIMVALLHKTKLLWDSLPLNIFVSFVIAAIFITASSATEILLNVVPWFAVLLIALFLIMALVGFIGGKGVEGMMGKGIAWVFIVLLIIVFLISGIKVFSNSLAPYWPSATYDDVSYGDPTLVSLFSWLYSPQVKGFFLLIGVAGLVTWILVKKGGLTNKK